MNLANVILIYVSAGSSFHSAASQFLRWLEPFEALSLFSAAHALFDVAYNQEDDVFATESSKNYREWTHMYSYHVLKSWAVCVRFLRSIGVAKYLLADRCRKSIVVHMWLLMLRPGMPLSGTAGAR